MDDVREAWRELVNGAALEAGNCSYCSGEEDMQFHGTDKHDPECPVPVVEAALDELDRLRPRSPPMDDVRDALEAIWSHVPRTITESLKEDHDIIRAFIEERGGEAMEIETDAMGAIDQCPTDPWPNSRYLLIRQEPTDG